MGRHSNVGRVTDDLVVDAPFAVRVPTGEVQRSGDDADRGVPLGQVPAELLEMRPVVTVEALSDLRAHVRQGESAVHGGLGPFGVGGGNLVATVVAGAEIV